MRLYRFFDFTRAEAMPGDVDHVVGAAEHEVIAVLVAGGPVERRVDKLVRHRFEIGLYESLVAAPNRGHATRRQRRRDRQHTLLAAPDLLARRLVQEPHVVPINGKRRRSEFARRLFDTGLRGENGPTTFGLPVVIDDRDPE